MFFTLVALWFNPAYLLLELDSVLKPGHCTCSWWERLDWGVLQQWVLYLLAPHHYVTMCLMRSVMGAHFRTRSGTVRLVVFGFVVAVGLAQFGGDFCSALALLLLLQQPSSPAALGIGYWLTTAGLFAATTAYAPTLLFKELGDDSDALGVWAQRFMRFGGVLCLYVAVYLAPAHLVDLVSDWVFSFV